MPSCKKLILTQIYVAIWRHRATTSWWPSHIWRSYVQLFIGNGQVVDLVLKQAGTKYTIRSLHVRGIGTWTVKYQTWQAVKHVLYDIGASVLGKSMLLQTNISEKHYIYMYKYIYIFIYIYIYISIATSLLTSIYLLTSLIVLRWSSTPGWYSIR